MGFPGGSVVKNLPANAEDTGDTGLIPGLRRIPGEGTGNPHQCSCLENPMDRGAWGGNSPQGCKESDATEVTQHAEHTGLHTVLEVQHWWSYKHSLGLSYFSCILPTSQGGEGEHRQRRGGKSTAPHSPGTEECLVDSSPLPISWVLAQLWAALVQPRVLSGPFLGPNKHPIIKLLVLFSKAYVTVSSTFCFSPSKSTTSKIPLNDENIYKLSSPGSCW